MPPTIEALENKYLESTANYAHLAGDSDLAAWGIALGADEEVIGIYDNSTDAPIRLVITNLGIHKIASDNISFLPFAEIDSVEPITSEKLTMLSDPSSRVLRIKRLDGQDFHLPALGSRETFLDVYDLWTFIRKVIWWQNKRRESEKFTAKQQSA